ncbi:MAG: dienelactone hydrolase family protein [Rhodospirillales bacterium]|jgi:carboxymethylenebutenolidase|nr:dienelactone hydrolase family protein [Rhodospirillales bacterium]
MGTNIKLTASDGHTLDAYRADPTTAPKGGLVVVQEIFGVNAHIRTVTDGFAAEGYAAIAPAFFDRTETGVELGYEEPDLSRGRTLRAELGWDETILDVVAAVDALDAAGKIGVVGYCWGGSVAWLAACRLSLAAAVGYYGGQVIDFKDEKAGCPVMLHFGETDAGIPLSDVEAVRAAQPDVPIHLYPAGHGFNCDHRGSYDAESAKLALERTLDFLADAMG